MGFLIFGIFTFGIIGFCLGIDGKLSSWGEKIHTKFFGPPLSWPAGKIMAKYKEIPKQHRPELNVLDAVKALDVKYGGAININKAYGGLDRAYLIMGYSWRNAKDKDFAGRFEYADMFNAIGSILDAVRDREHQFKLAGVQADLDNVASITEKLRSEATIINQVTKEML